MESTQSAPKNGDLVESAPRKADPLQMARNAIQSAAQMYGLVVSATPTRIRTIIAYQSEGKALHRNVPSDPAQAARKALLSLDHFPRRNLENIVNRFQRLMDGTPADGDDPTADAEKLMARAHLAQELLTDETHLRRTLVAVQSAGKPKPCPKTTTRSSSAGPSSTPSENEARSVPSKPSGPDSDHRAA